MTFEEIKKTLLGATEEGADMTSIIDSVLEEVASLMSRVTESEKQTEELTNRIADLTSSNLKLIDKIKYIEGDDGIDGNESNEEITLDNLFEEV